MYESSDSPSPLAATPRNFPFGSPLALAVVAFSFVPLALFLFSLLGRYSFFAELLSNFRCQILFLLLPFALLLPLLRQWWMATVFAVATAWCMTGVVWVYFPDAQPPAGPQTIKIMSFNVLANSHQRELALPSILKHDPDIVLIVEFANEWTEALKPLRAHYPYTALKPRWHGFGIGLFSKFPLTDTHIQPLTPDIVDAPMLVTHVTLGEQKVRLVGLHVLSPTNRVRMEYRNLQFEEAAKFLKDSDTPTVVMGDFNCTPWSPYLRDFSESTGYRDSRQGFGYHATWHKDFGIFKVPIDHAFVSNQIHVHDRYVGEPSSSDHLPIIFEISVSE